MHISRLKSLTFFLKLLVCRRLAVSDGIFGVTRSVDLRSYFCFCPTLGKCLSGMPMRQHLTTVLLPFLRVFFLLSMLRSWHARLQLHTTILVDSIPPLLSCTKVCLLLNHLQQTHQYFPQYHQIQVNLNRSDPCLRKSVAYPFKRHHTIPTSRARVEIKLQFLVVLDGTILEICRSPGCCTDNTSSFWISRIGTHSLYANVRHLRVCNLHWNSHFTVQ